MKTADYYIHGRGRGHASRSPVVRAALAQAGYRVQLHAGGDAMDLLSDDDVQLRSPLRRSPLSPLRLGLRTLEDGLRFASQRPDLIVSDGDHGAVLGGRLLRVPVLAIGHDLVFDRRVRLPSLPLAPLRAQRINALPSRAASRFVAVHFLPAESDHPGFRIARPEGPLQTPSLADPEAPIVCYFRDGNGAPVAEALAKAGREVLLFGPGASPAPGVQAHPFSQQAFRTAMNRCSAVVGSAGSNMLAECVLLRKPVLAVYRAGDAEQHLNALLIERASVGMARALHDAPRAAERFVRRVQRRDFATVDLQSALPPLSAAVADTLAELDQTAS